MQLEIAVRRRLRQSPPPVTSQRGFFLGIPRAGRAARQAGNLLSLQEAVMAAEAGVMRETAYGLKVDVPLAFDAAVERATEALKDQGFGVLTTIDVQQTLKAKLNREFRKYVILGACNPSLADRALHAELDIGLLLPCNVIVYETEPGRSVVAAMAPVAALGLVDNPELGPVAAEADQRLRAALGAIERQ
jgi:uncharacterized protein (DUF302 family)